MVTTAGKGGYTAPPPSPVEHHEVIEDIQIIVQGMRTQGYDPEGMVQDNAVLTSSNFAVTAQLAQMTMFMNAIQAQLKTLASAQNNQARQKSNFYCWSCGRNFTHGRITCPAKKEGNQEEAYYKKKYGWQRNVCE